MAEEQETQTPEEEQKRPPGQLSQLYPALLHLLKICAYWKISM